jgi:hypothetical protein
LPFKIEKGKGNRFRKREGGINLEGWNGLTGVHRGIAKEVV